MEQRGFFSLSEHLEKLSEHGDPLEVLDATVDFEYFRGWLVEGLGYGDGRKGGRPPFDPVSAENAPTNWTDLNDPKWEGKIAVSHPGYSGSTGSWAVLMKKLYGSEFFEKLEALDPLIGRSLIDPPTVVTAGEREIGISSLATATRLKLSGNPLEIVYPEDGAKLTLSGTGILWNAPHPNAAKLFLNYLLSVRADELMVGQGQQPLRPEVAPPAGIKALDEIPLGELTEKEVVEQVPDIIVEWRDVFGG